MTDINFLMRQNLGPKPAPKPAPKQVHKHKHKNAPENKSVPLNLENKAVQVQPNSTTLSIINSIKNPKQKDNSKFIYSLISKAIHAKEMEHLAKVSPILKIIDLEIRKNHVNSQTESHIAKIEVLKKLHHEVLHSANFDFKENHKYLMELNNILKNKIPAI